MHIAYTSEQTMEKRRQKVADVRKRAEYRKAHGIEEEHVFGGWTAKSDEELLGAGMREGGEVEAVHKSQALEGVDAEVGGKAAEGAYVDFAGKQQSVRKKWLGIW